MIFHHTDPFDLIAGFKSSSSSIVWRMNPSGLFKAIRAAFAIGPLNIGSIVIYAHVPPIRAQRAASGRPATVKQPRHPITHSHADFEEPLRGRLPSL